MSKEQQLKNKTFLNSLSLKEKKQWIANPYMCSLIEQAKRELCPGMYAILDNPGKYKSDSTKKVVKKKKSIKESDSDSDFSDIGIFGGGLFSDDEKENKKKDKDNSDNESFDSDGGIFSLFD